MQSMKYDIVVFDVDGTLWNACPTTAKGVNRALRELGMSRVLTTEEIEKISGQPQDHAIKLLFGELPLNAEMLKALDDGERKAIEEEGGAFYEGVVEGFRELSKHTQLFLVSNCQDWYLEDFVRLAGLAEFLKGRNCYGLSHLSKHEMLEDIVQRFNGKKAVYVGDTSGDQKAAELAGIDFIGAAYGFGDVSNAKITFKTFPAITEFLLR